MTYTVCYSRKERREIWTVQQPTAREALRSVDALRSKGNEIKFIDVPREGQVGIDMLRILADEEGLPGISS